MKKPMMMPADILVNESIEDYNKRTNSNFSNIDNSVKSEVLKWLVEQHNQDYKNCPTRLITHDYVLKLAEHLAGSEGDSCQK